MTIDFGLLTRTEQRDKLGKIAEYVRQYLNEKSEAQESFPLLRDVCRHVSNELSCPEYEVAWAVQMLEDEGHVSVNYWEDTISLDI